MNAYIYYDAYQEALGKDISTQYPNIKVIPNEIELNMFDETKLPLVLILVSQPSDHLKEKLSGVPWSFNLIHKGIRFENEKMYHFDSLVSFSNQLKEAFELFKKNLMTLYEEHHRFETVETSKSKRLNIPLLKGIYTVSGDTHLLSQLVKTYASNVKNQKVLVIDGNLIRPSFDRIYGLSSLFTKVNSQLKGIDNTGFNILYDAISKNIPLEGLLNDITVKHRQGFEYVLGNYNIFNYEHYQLETLSHLLKVVRKHYDVVFVNTDTFISDTFSLLCYHESEKIIFATGEEVEDVRYMKQILEVLSIRQGIIKEKCLVVVKKNSKAIKFMNTTFKTIFGNQFTDRIDTSKNNGKALCKLFRAMGE